MGANWESLTGRRATWEINLTALGTHNPRIADLIAQHRPVGEYLIAIDPLRMQLGRKMDGKIEVLPNPMPQDNARDIARRLYPSGQCTEPALIAGLDQGWLWQALYELPCHTPAVPGHRLPLYFLSNDLERLWAILHLHDWSKLLADPRVRLFVGADAVEQCRRSMMDNPQVPWPKLCATIDPAIWPAGVTVDSMWQSAHESANQQMQQLSRDIEAMYAGLSAKSIAQRLRGQNLRVMGITSLYTTFLKYSMSDWLDAMVTMGHEAMIVIENGDHEINNPLRFAREVSEFRPDLILMIDHFRAEVAGLPQQIPCVMWVQDSLPNIFSLKAGKAQGPRDYCLGFGRLALRERYGYPEQRFLPAQIGVNDSRFAPSELSSEDRALYGCDISFVSHASAPATALLTEQLQRADEGGRKLLIDIFEQMRAIYDRGEAITHASIIGKMIDRSLARYRLNVDDFARRSLFDFFTQRIDNALFRHQALSWAAEMDVKMHIWGRGWEQHPQFGRYAKGIACNRSQLSMIYQASKINLQVTPFGAVHQRMLDGLAAGGFFMVRYCPGDCVETIYQRIYEWCMSNGIEDDQSLRTKCTAPIRALLTQLQSLSGVNPFEMGSSFMDVLRLSADGEYIRSAAAIWPEYERVCFRSSRELHTRAVNFLENENERQALAQSMRRTVIQRLSYSSISRRLLDFVADDLDRGAAIREVAA